MKNKKRRIATKAPTQPREIAPAKRPWLSRIESLTGTYSLGVGLLAFVLSVAGLVIGRCDRMEDKRELNKLAEEVKAMDCRAKLSGYPSALQDLKVEQNRGLIAKYYGEEGSELYLRSQNAKLKKALDELKAVLYRKRCSIDLLKATNDYLAQVETLNRSIVAGGDIDVSLNPFFLAQSQFFKPSSFADICCPI